MYNTKCIKHTLENKSDLSHKNTGYVYERKQTPNVSLNLGKRFNSFT